MNLIRKHVHITVNANNTMEISTNIVTRYEAKWQLIPNFRYKSNPVILFVEIRVGICAGHVGHRPLYLPDPTISEASRQSRADLKFSPEPTELQTGTDRGMKLGTRVLPGYEMGSDIPCK